MLSVGNIAKLIADKACIADGCLSVSVRVSENPRIYTAISNEATQLSYKPLLSRLPLCCGATTANDGR